MMATSSRAIKVAFQNIHGSASRLQDAVDWFLKRNGDVFIMVESWRREEDLPLDFPTIADIRCNNSYEKKGILIFSKGVLCQQIRILKIDVNKSWIILQIHSTILVVTYQPPLTKEHPTRDEEFKLFWEEVIINELLLNNSSEGDLVIIGDFNARSTKFGDTRICIQEVNGLLTFLKVKL
jgi:exonuclease III